jgi:hypothetical protein
VSPETEKLARERIENQCGAPSAKKGFFGSFVALDKRTSIAYFNLLMAGDFL